jgi:two-component system, NarL family, nitrate/nitrite response regulator NarL
MTDNLPFAMPARILILEDQPDGIALLTAAIKGCFDQPQIHLAVNLASVQQLVSNQPRHQPFDYALVDLRLPDGLSIDWLAHFKTDFPETQAIVTSLYDDDDLVFAALRAGADGYVLKGDGVEHLQHALRKVMLGEPPISPSIARKLMGQFRVSSAVVPSATSNLPTESTTFASSQSLETSDQPRLTSRETEVLAMIGSGLMIKQVASQLGIGYHTVNDNIKSIYRKLGIRTRAQAAAEAGKRGLIAQA